MLHRSKQNSGAGKPYTIPLQGTQSDESYGLTHRLEALEERIQILTKVITPRNYHFNQNAPGTPPSAKDQKFTHISVLDLAKMEYKLRRQRESVFEGCEMFADPAWDMLLDLFISEIEGKVISTTSLCIASCVPSTTALRWISVLEKNGLIYKVSDNTDKRRQFVKLSKNAFEKMISIFESRLNSAQNYFPCAG